MESIEVGDTIEFNFFGSIKRGKVIQIGKYGYWINDNPACFGEGSIRCPFEGARKVQSASSPE